MLFNETIMVTGVRERGRRVYAADLRCRYLDDGVYDGATDNQLAANTDMAAFFVPVAEWPDAKPPQVGDAVTREDGRKYRVGRVTRLGDCFSISARSR